jgi:hypothetical protein
MATGFDVPLTPIIDTVTGSVSEIGRIFLRRLAEAVGALAPVTARYWLSTADPSLTNEQNLGALASGYLKVTQAIGVATPSTVAAIPQADVTGLVAALAAVATLPITEANVTGLVADLALKAPLASPALTGTPTAPTAAGATNTTQLATTAFVQALAALLAPVASPTFTGTPAAPTAGVGTNTTQVATTAFVLANGSAFAGVLNALLDLTGAAAGQIAFPAAQHASANANTLDDYEEGTWTPTDASGAGLSLTITSATYTKIGRLVFARAHVTYPATASGASAKLGGLPFPVAGYSTAAISSNSATALQVGEFVTGTAFLQPLGPASAAAITNANLTGSFVIAAGCYEV